MKSQLRVFVVTVGLFCAATGFAQTAAPVSKASSPVNASVAPAAKTAAPTTATAGGGFGKVWVNTNAKTYHCEGTKFYGKTMVGQYLTESDAKAKGNHADHGKACAKLG